MISERQVSTEERNHDHARLAGAAAGAKRPWAYVLGNLTPEVGSRGELLRWVLAYKMYERNAISGRWSFAHWVPLGEVDEDRDLVLGLD
jgi:hypothetical protein